MSDNPFVTVVTQESFPTEVTQRSAAVPVLVDFWATWCKPCLKTMPRLQKLYSAHSDRGLRVLGVSIDEDQDRIKKIKRIIGKMKISYPIFIDTQRHPPGISLK